MEKLFPSPTHPYVRKDVIEKLRGFPHTSQLLLLLERFTRGVADATAVAEETLRTAYHTLCAFYTGELSEKQVREIWEELYRIADELPDVLRVPPLFVALSERYGLCLTSLHLTTKNLLEWLERFVGKFGDDGLAALHDIFAREERALAHA